MILQTLIYYIFQAFGFLLFTGLIFLIFWRWGRRLIQSRRIQPIQTADAKQFRFELKASFLAMTIAALSSALITLLYNWGYTQISNQQFGQLHLGWTLLSFASLVIWNDTWYYWVHRMLHTPWFYKHIHGVHHKSVDVSPFSAYSFHPGEALLLSLWSVPYVLLWPVELSVLLTFQLYVYAKNLELHMGYEFLPRWFLSTWPMSLWTSSTYHNHHHTHPGANFGLYLRFWDHLLKTEDKSWLNRRKY